MTSAQTLSKACLFYQTILNIPVPLIMQTIFSELQAVNLSKHFERHILPTLLRLKPTFHY